MLSRRRINGYTVTASLHRESLLMTGILLSWTVRAVVLPRGTRHGGIVN